jgi:hypothetical protein
MQDKAAFGAANGIEELRNRSLIIRTPEQTRLAATRLDTRRLRKRDTPLDDRLTPADGRDVRQHTSLPELSRSHMT